MLQKKEKKEKLKVIAIIILFQIQLLIKFLWQKINYIQKKIQKKRIFFIFKTENTKNEKNKNLVFKLNDYELNSLSYEEALIKDNRTYFQYYISLLKTKNIFIFAFYPYNNDYNSMIIKICLFLFSFALYYTVNGLFLLIQQCIKYMKSQELLILFIIYPK